MTIADLPILTAVKSKMRWHAARQKLLAQNVANADTSGFAPKDLKPFEIKPAPGPVSVGPVRTQVAHLGGSAETGADFRSEPARRFETTASGNAVSLEEEMMKIASNQMDYQAAVSLYERGMSLIRSAVGKRA
jgi:flagellar basal-body rod protein FlgB